MKNIYIRKKSNEQLAFLDVLVKRHINNFLTSVYKKNPFTWNYLNFRSFRSIKRNINLVRTLCDRAHKICLFEALQGSNKSVKNDSADGKKKRRKIWRKASTCTEWTSKYTPIQGFQQDHEHNKLFRQRHLRAHCRWSFAFGSLQQAFNHQQSRDSTCCSSVVARWVG